jgi:ribosomal protein S18 acetylase RimI-like enzyme
VTADAVAARMAVRIDRLTPAHRADVERVVRDAGVFADDEVAVAMELFDATSHSGERADEDADYQFLGAFAGDALVGYACFGATPATDRTWDLYWIAVHPRAQGMGAGRALLASVERLLAARDARLLVVETSSRADYAAARRFYLHHGYTLAGQVRDFYAPGDDRMLFTKRLTSCSPVSHPSNTSAPGRGGVPQR